MNGQDSSTTLTTDQVIAALATSVATLQSGVQQFNTIAASYHLQAYSYEGGRDTFGPHNIAAKKAAALDSRMASIIQSYMTMW